MDDADLAQQNEETFLENVSRRFGLNGNQNADDAFSVEPPASGPSPIPGAGPGARGRRCIGWGEGIEAARLKAVPGAVRCVECQAGFERDGRVGAPP
jgi:hypothetical protein